LLFHFVISNLKPLV